MKRKIDKFVLGVFLYWLLMVTTAWVAYFVTGAVPDTLVTVGLSGGAVELVLTAVIECVTNKDKDKDKDKENV